MEINPPCQPITVSMEALIQQMIKGPCRSRKPFIFKGDTFADVYALACKIRMALHHTKNTDQPICLCSFDRALVAAALLATLAEGRRLILPYAFSAQVLAETHRTFGYATALVDEPRPLPPGVTVIDPDFLGSIQTDLPQPSWLRPDQAWVYLFTGGSTGKPQTWTKTPLNLLAETVYLINSLGITTGDTVLASVPCNHIYGLLYGVLVPLVACATVCGETPTFPQEIVELMDRSKATVLVSIPAHYRGLASQLPEGMDLRLAFSSAGALAPDDDQVFFETFGVSITEIYGSTETGGIATRRRTAGQPDLQAFECVKWKIDRDTLLIRSDFLSPELSQDEMGYYRTADRAAANGKHGFRLLGRADGIVKVAGKRVDLAEIQTMIQQTPGIDDAYVFARRIDRGRENEILALVCGCGSLDLVRERLKQRFEAYAHPRKIQVVNRIPTSTTGKYNRRKIERLFE